MSATDRIVVLVDMDCFYCQVEQKLNPSLYGKPLAVVQYNAWKGGGLIAVNYEARAKGVTRHMRGDEAKAKCPEIELARVPSVRGKADLTRYRDAGKQVADVLQTFTALLERASVDEAYLDITEAVEKRLEMCIKPELLRNSHVVGFDSVADFLREIYSDASLNDSNIKLAIGGVITEEIRAAVYDRTGYRCSAGVAHNKVLAKLTCGLHKPNKQTILPHESISKLYKNLSIKKIRSMGGKFGDEVIHKLKITNMVDLVKFSEKELQQHFEEKTANWLYNIARGINHEPVVVRLVSKSIGCCKQFRGRAALKTEKDVRHWTQELSMEIADRIEKDIAENNRKPRQLIVSYSQAVGRKDVSSTRSQALNTIEQVKIYNEAYETIRKNCQRSDGSFGIKFLSLNVGKFEDIKNVTNITSFFKNCAKRASGGAGPAVVASPGSSKASEKYDDNELERLSKEIYAIVQANIELNKSFSNSNAGESNDVKAAEATAATAATEESDDSEAELEAINASVTEANTSSTGTVIKNSFFRNFLNADVPKRDFNTSAILNEVEVEDEETENQTPNVANTESGENSKNYSRNSPIINSNMANMKTTMLSMLTNNGATTSAKSFITDDNKELCMECNKLIPVENIVSHMDYHFALKMVRDEAYLYKPQKIINKEDAPVPAPDKPTKGSSNKSKSKMSTTPSRKRKGGSNSDIAMFLTKARDDMITEEDSEVCPDCCKRIKLDDLASHVDYHVAKKLHLELNAVNVAVNNTSVKSGNIGKVISKNCDNGSIKNSVDKNRAITAFFKKV